MADVGARICSAKIGSDNISTLNDLSLNDGADDIVSGAAGNHEGEVVIVLKELPVASFTTRLINALSSYSYGQHSVYWRMMADGGIGGNSYKSITGTSGKTMAVPRSLTWSEGGVASLAIDMMFFSSNGVAAPFTVGSSSGNLTAETLQWIGAGSGVTSITVDFGLSITPMPNGALYPSNCFVGTSRPTLRWVTTDMSLLTTGMIAPGVIQSASVSFAQVPTGGVRGSALTFTLTGKHSVKAIQGDKPATLEVGVVGVGAFTIS